MHFEVEDGKVTRMDDFPIDTYEWERFSRPHRSRPQTNGSRNTGTDDHDKHTRNERT
jgi:hypothetical protein